MRTHIVIDDTLMEAAMEAGGFKTQRDAVEEGLRLLARRVVLLTDGRDFHHMEGLQAWTV